MKFEKTTRPITRATYSPEIQSMLNKHSPVVRLCAGGWDSMTIQFNANQKNLSCNMHFTVVMCTHL